MSKLRMTYRGAIIWLVGNDDNQYLIDAASHFEFVPLSVPTSYSNIGSVLTARFAIVLVIMLSGRAHETLS